MKGLTQARRDQARLKAQASIRKRLGAKPERSAFNDYAVSKFRGIQKVVSAGLLIVAITSGWVSAVRLYLAGFEYAKHLGTPLSINISIGVATPLAAEVLVIVATIAAQVYLSRWKVVLAFIPVVVGMAVAFVGNWTITRPSTEWGWVEMAFPPLAVLSVAFIFEIVYVPELDRREKNEDAYQAAVANWQRIENDPELDERWLSTFANMLRESLCQVNRMTVDDLTAEEWAERVDDELHAEDWYSPDLQANRLNGAGEPGETSQEKMLRVFMDNPGLVSDLQAQRTSQSTIAREYDVSQSAVSRALKKIAQNGHGGEQ